MEYRIIQTDEDEWMPQAKSPFMLFGVEIFKQWINLREEPFPKYEDAVVHLKKAANKIEKTLKIRENRMIMEFDVDELVKEQK